MYIRELFRELLFDHPTFPSFPFELETRDQLTEGEVVKDRNITSKDTTENRKTSSYIYKTGL